jgi:imidazolonepropionase-like amidohydrolase
MHRILTAAAFAAASLAYAENFALRGVTIHPVSAAEVPNAVLVVTGDRIADFGPKAAIPKGHKIIDAKGLHVYPGMIDSASVLGLSEIGSVRETQDIAELGDFNPQLRTMVAVNPGSEHIPVSRASGITSSVVVPAGGFIGGQASIMHLDGWTWEEMTVSPSAAMQMRLPSQESTVTGRALGTGRRSYAEVKRRYEEQMQQVRLFFEQARAYQARKANPVLGFKPDLRLEAMIPVLEGKTPLMIVAPKERAIRDAIAFAEREKVKIILAGVREVDPFLEELAGKKIPVVLPDLYQVPLEEDASIDEPLDLPAKLAKAGIAFAFGSYNIERPRNLPFQAANAVGNGLSHDAALKALTLGAAEIWGIADRLGSIDKGKLADFILTDGDPLEPKTQIRQMWILGKPVSLENRHTKLYEQYKKRL